MQPIGGRSPATAVGSLLGLLLSASIVAGCSGASSNVAQTDPKPLHSARRPDPFPGLPGRDEHKLRDGAGDLRLVHFHSQALGRDDAYLIYLPRGYAAAARRGARFPVLYLLHGDGRHDRHGAGHLFQRGRIGPAASSLFASGRMPPMLIVMPEAYDGTVVGDNEWANTPRGRFESDVLDLVRSVDSTWPTVASRSGRAIAGLSMGGYGAINIALHHLDLFSTAESWSGYFTQTRTGPFAGASDATLRANSPAQYVSGLASQLRADPLHVLLYISPTDPLRVQQGPFAAQLRSLGVPVESRFFGGPHNFSLWADHMDMALGFADRWLSSQGATGT
jgi:S-formylglutathione hydrolase FrmB